MPRAAEQALLGEEISQMPVNGFFLSDDPVNRTEETSRLISEELDDFSEPLQKELMRKINVQTKVPLKNCI